MSNLTIHDLEVVDTLSHETLRTIGGGYRYAGIGWALPYQHSAAGSLPPIMFVGELNQYFVNADHFEINQIAIVDVDAAADNGANVDINLLLGQAGLG